jgi:hypothetical protein
MGIMDTMSIAPNAFFGLLLKAVFPVIISLYYAIPSGIFCIPMVTAKAVIDPAADAAIDAPIARDSGIESNPIPSNMPAPHPFFSNIICNSEYYCSQSKCNHG